jgi:hypothetical protein
MDFSGVASLSFTAEQSFERVALKVMFAILVVLGCMYLYFVTSSILHVMGRREALAKVNDIQGSIGSLEQQYFALSQAISPSEGASLGLTPVADVSYVYRPGTIGAATIARNDI